MLRLTDGNNEILVTNGAAKDFMKQGWRLVQDEQVEQEQANLALGTPDNSGDKTIQPEDENGKSEQKTDTGDTSNSGEGNSPDDEGEGDENSEGKTDNEDKKLQELLERPLGELTAEELKILATHFNINYKGKNKQAVRDEIAEAMK